MSEPFVSVHQIVKENTNLGCEFINACYTSLLESGYPNEIVVVDNGSAPFVFDVYSEWKKKFKDIDCNFILIKSDANTFCDLRNRCLESTYPKADFIMWCDSDEVWYPEDLDFLKTYVMLDTKNIAQIWTYFYHFITHPFQIQVDPIQLKKNELTLDFIRCSKDNIFKYHKGLQWTKEKKVHEKMSNVLEGEAVWSTQSEYLHYGYCRHQWRTFLKWLHYDIIEHGHVGGYKDENITDKDGNIVEQKDYLRDWRVPNGNFLWDRNAICIPYPATEIGSRDYLPEGAKQLIGDCKNEKDWIKRIDDLDGNEFLHRWEEKVKEVGSWKNSLDWVVEECQKTNWGLV